MASSKNLHVDQRLTDFSVKTKNEKTAFIADQIFQPVPVNKKTDMFVTWDSNQLKIYTDAVTKGVYNRLFTAEPSNTTFKTIKRGLEQGIPLEDLDNQDDVLDIEFEATEELTEAYLVSKEYLTASIACNTTTMASYSKDLGAEGMLKLDDPTAPINDYLKDARTSIFNATGLVANSVLIPFSCRQALLNNNWIQEQKYVMNIVTNDDLPPSIAGLKVVKADAIYDTTAYGATASLSEIWSDNIVVFHQSPSPSRRSQAFAKRMIWRKYPFSIIKFDDQIKEERVIRVREYAVPQIITAGAGYLIYDCL